MFSPDLVDGVLTVEELLIAGIMPVIMILYITAIVKLAAGGK